MGDLRGTGTKNTGNWKLNLPKIFKTDKSHPTRPENIEKCSGAGSGKMFKLHQNVLGIKKI